MKILIIDDSPMQQKIARIYLEKGEGHEVLSANNGKEGLVSVSDNHPELILLDVEMPELNGEETLKRLKSDEYTKDIPVIMCTAAEDPTLEERLMKMGAAAFIKKPHGFSTLKNIIKELVK